jgi:hypothetical protein
MHAPNRIFLFLATTAATLHGGFWVRSHFTSDSLAWVRTGQLPLDHIATGVQSKCGQLLWFRTAGMAGVRGNPVQSKWVRDCRMDSCFDPRFNPRMRISFDVAGFAVYDYVRPRPPKPTEEHYLRTPLWASQAALSLPLLLTWRSQRRARAAEYRKGLSSGFEVKAKQPIIDTSAS